jgi:hypothetical protein
VGIFLSQEKAGSLDLSGLKETHYYKDPSLLPTALTDTTPLLPSVFIMYQYLSVACAPELKEMAVSCLTDTQDL